MNTKKVAIELTANRDIAVKGEDNHAASTTNKLGYGIRMMILYCVGDYYQIPKRNSLSVT